MSIDTVENRGAIAKVDGRLPANPKSFSAYLSNHGRQAAISATAASFMDTNRLIKILLRCVAMNPQLQRCTMDSVFRSALMAAELGLELGSALGEAYLVPYRETCQMIPGYRGLIALARRSGQITDIYARAVFVGDEFEVALGTEEYIKHVPKFGARNPDQLTYVYAVAKMAGGGSHFDVMTKEEVNAIRSRSASKGGPWVTDYVEMAKKTVIRRMCKTLPMSVEMAKATALQDAMETGDFSDVNFDCLEGDVVGPIENMAAIGATSEETDPSRGSDALKEKLRANGNGTPAAAPQPTVEDMAAAEQAKRQEEQAAVPATTQAEAPAPPSAPARSPDDIRKEFSARARETGFTGKISDLVTELLGYPPLEWNAKTWALALAESPADLAKAITKLQGGADTRPPIAPPPPEDTDADFAWEDEGRNPTAPGLPGAFK